MKRFLLADDHALLRKGLANLLKAEFASAVIGEAATSEQAMELVHAKKWDLVILDIDLGGRCGLELLECIRGARPELPVLIFSLHPVAELAVRAIEIGASGYVSKLGAAEEVLAAAQAVLTGKCYVSALLAERLADKLQRGRQRPHESLSVREHHVLRMIAMGKNLKQIAGDLRISAKTVGTYHTRVLQKMRLKNDIELTRYVLLNKLAD